MQLNCPNCNEPILAPNINIQTSLAVCDHCHHVLNFGNRIPVRKSKPRKIKQPPRLRLTENKDWLEMTYTRIFNPDGKKALVINTLIVFAFVLCFIGAITDYASPVTMFLIEAPPVAWFSYWIATLLVNTTRVSLDHERLVVQYGPLPALPVETRVEEKTLRQDDIVHVYCEETEESRKAGSLNRHYHLCAGLVGGSQLILLKSLPQDYAYFIAQTLEECLRTGVDTTPLEYDDTFQGDATPDAMPLALLLADEESTNTASDDDFSLMSRSDRRQ